MNKKLHLKSLLLLCALIVGSSSSWAADDTIVFGELGLENGVQYSDPFDGGGFTVTFAGGGNDGKYYNTGSGIRVYGGGTMTVAAKGTTTISKIEIAFDGTNKPESSDVVNAGTYDPENTIWTGDAQSVVFTRPTGSGHWRVKSVAVTYANSSDTRTETTVTISGNETEVTMGDAVATPIATVTALGSIVDVAVKWSSSNTDIATIDESTGEISLVKAGTTTIKATFNGNDDYKKSDASYTLTVKAAASELITYTKIEDLQKDATATETPIKFTFNNILVTAVKNKNAYITDGTYGALVYTDGHGLKAGDVINGTIETTLVLYKGQTEITGVKSTDENLTITSSTVTPTEKTLDEITAANQSLLVTLKGLTYNSSDKTFTDEKKTITYYRNFTDSDPTLENGKIYDVTGVVIVFNEKLEISPLNIEDVVEVVSATQEVPVTAWVSGIKEVSSICVLPGETLSVSLSTNSTGSQTFESSNSDVATVDGDGNITLNGAGVAVITAATEANDDFFASNATLTIVVAEKEAEDGVFDFALFNDYGSGIVPHNSNYNYEESTWTAGNVTMKVSGKYRWFLNTSNVGDFRVYNNDSPTAFTITAPEGYYITKINGVSVSLNVDKGSITSGTWTGMENEVTFSYNSSNVTIKKLTVIYTKPEVDVTIGEGYTSFCPTSNLDFSETGVKVYTAKRSGSTVNLTEVESGIVPAGAGVILGGTAGTYTATVQATAEKLENNELKGVTEDTQVDYQQSETMFNYILQGGVFKKATGATLKAGKAYLHTQYDVAGGSSRLTIVVAGEATGIKAIETAADKNVYDLQGRKVAAPSKGLYIINGKKMIVK